MSYRVFISINALSVDDLSRHSKETVSLPLLIQTLNLLLNTCSDRNYSVIDIEDLVPA